MNEREREPFSEITGMALILFGLTLIILSVPGAITDQKLSNGPLITGAAGLGSGSLGALTWKFGHYVNLSEIFNF